MSGRGPSSWITGPPAVGTGTIPGRGPSAAASTARRWLRSATSGRVVRPTREIDSTPAATKTSLSPVAMAWKPVRTACMLDAHMRLTVEPGTVTGSPASRATRRPRLYPCSRSG